MLTDSDPRRVYPEEVIRESSFSNDVRTKRKLNPWERNLEDPIDDDGVGTASSYAISAYIQCIGVTVLL